MIFTNVYLNKMMSPQLEMDLLGWRTNRAHHFLSFLQLPVVLFSSILYVLQKIQLEFIHGCRILFHIFLRLEMVIILN